MIRIGVDEQISTLSRVWLIVVILLSICAAPALAQIQNQTSDTPPDNASSPRSDDIVVEALLPPGEKLPTTIREATTHGLQNRKDYENSQRIAKCALKANPARLRAAIEGAPNSAPQRAAQIWLIRRTITCNGNTSLLSVIANPPGSTSRAAPSTDGRLSGGLIGNSSYFAQSVIGTSVLDRGALLEAVINTYVPDLRLTRANTGNPAVQARLNQRETSLNRFRLPADYKYFETAICMVRLQPELSVQLVNAKPGSSIQRKLQAAIINRARICVGNAKRVFVDGTQFRLYIMDAVYRWTVATRGVDSLLPGDDQRNG